MGSLGPSAVSVRFRMVSRTLESIVVRFCWKKYDIYLSVFDFDLKKTKKHELYLIQIFTSAAPLTNLSKKEPSSSTRTVTLSCVSTILTRVSLDRLVGSRSNSAFCLEERESRTAT